MFPIDFLVKAARAWPSAIAAEDSARSITFADLLATSRALAYAIQEATGKVHPSVAVLSPNSLDLMVAIMAVHAGGFTFTPLNPRNADVELASQIATAKPDLIIVDPSARKRLAGYAGRVFFTHDTPDGPSIAGLAQRFAGAIPRWEHVDPDTVNALKFTGGSSGKPKAVLQTFRNFNTVVVSLLSAFAFDEKDRYLVAAPMTHGAGMFMMPILAAGGTCVIPDHVDAPAMIEAFETRRITTTWIPPTLLYMLLEQPGLEKKRFHLRHLIWGGAAAAPEKLKQARAAFGDVIECVFGQTEASTIATALRAHEMVDDSLWASVGRPTPLMQVEIMAPDGRILPAGEAGEIVLRGDLVMKGYLGMPRETAETLRGGWLHTGDIGYLDAHGYLFIKDRMKDVVISGGFNVYPSDVEAALARHPAVGDSVVFGLPDEKWGERVEAAVQLKAGAAATEDELIAFAKTQVGSVKAPKHIHIMPELPKSPVGKVLRRDVKAMFAAKTAG